VGVDELCEDDMCVDDVLVMECSKFIQCSLKRERGNRLISSCL
jgi:hypothetical protein